MTGLVGGGEGEGTSGKETEESAVTWLTQVVGASLKLIINNQHLHTLALLVLDGSQRVPLNERSRARMMNPTSPAAWKTFRESSSPSDYCSDTLFPIRSGREAHCVRKLLTARTRTLSRDPGCLRLALSSQGKEGSRRGFGCQLHKAAPPTNRPLALRVFRGPLRKVLEGL